MTEPAAQITETETTDTTEKSALTVKYSAADVVKRNFKRRLPCKLTDEEQLRIAKTRVAKEAERDELVADAKLDSDRRKEQIKSYDDEILVMRRELHTGSQDRTIATNEVFCKDDKGNCFIQVYRLDTNEPTNERWPASPAEMQRFLPDAEGTGSLLEQANKAQRSAQPAPANDGVPEGLPTDEADGGGEDEADASDEPGDSKPKRGGKKGK